MVHEGVKGCSGRTGHPTTSTSSAPASPACTTTISAARTTSPPTGQRPGDGRGGARRAADGPGQPGVPAPGRASSWPTPGIRQFLDIGSGIPTVGNVHEIAQRAAPGRPGGLRRRRPGRGGAQPGDPRRQRPGRRRSRRTCAARRRSSPTPTCAAARLRPAGGRDGRGGAALRPGRRPSAELLRTLARRAGARAATWCSPTAGEDGRRRPSGPRRNGSTGRTDNPLCIRSRAELTALFDGFSWSIRGWSGCRSGDPRHPESAEDAERAGFMGGVGRLDG